MITNPGFELSNDPPQDVSMTAVGWDALEVWTVTVGRPLTVTFDFAFVNRPTDFADGIGLAHPGGRWIHRSSREAFGQRGRHWNGF